MGIIAMITVILGLKKLVDIIGTVGPIIVILTIGICLIVFFSNIGNLSNMLYLPESAKNLQPTTRWWQDGGLFFFYNILAGSFFFSQLGQQSNSSKEAGYTGIVCGSGLNLS